MRIPFLAAALAATALPASAADRPVLTVYTYESFVAEWGPGPIIEAAFEKTCGCDLNFVAAGDGAALLARLRLEGERTRADLVLGLDTNLTAAATETGLFAPHDQHPDRLDLPVAWNDPLFLPYDWSYFAFVYDKTRLPEPPASFEALIAAPEDLKIVIQDPRSSTPGLGLLLWVRAAYGERAPEIWEGLAPHILTVTKGWTESYGLFIDGEADMALSYTTSPAYHLIAEDDDTKAAARFDEGHYLQIEVAGLLASSDQPELARQFLDFMLTEPFQSAIPTTNWMYPAVTPEAGLPAGFETLIQPDTALLFPADEAARVRDEALAEWRDALSR
ncbi:thiamine ABC transporter substrate binding subunit [Rhodovulum sulfidophilum]|uniref:thiamine ABC transporter substrate binding subunit n=1 Tax=Rhodovulum sulfidophilum TaxID=35806 RepID=UPI001922763D|nr:thiamine ABC transporter substrate binding subunit [Rhodovulum sulfidophilum]MBL3573555.1 thiamine ABC transporter substrate binding subunit [Rhodovulum sulfidophilum]MCE8429987.1 thiamine ABC transporter substrate binding subunit [Rhodovulum sulfidophilum]MCF4118727.1 thiamine ABC transporter substrate binding subunit [Rhodovulum sulfidophilum]